MIKMRALFTLLMGAASLRVAFASDQSELTVPEEQPIENSGGKRRMETPEVVLQLKYESGELNRIYLAQFRKDKEPWAPSVVARTDLCADLCHAGLGGEACGPTCPNMLPVGLQSALHSNESTGAVWGEPRVSVCPTLCHNNLGRPLCNCEALLAEPEQNNNTKPVEWTSVCTAFCVTDRYVLGGCPPCDDTSLSTTVSPILLTSARVLDTADGWTAWCNVQCRQGQGGAACNCDRAPFS